MRLTERAHQIVREHLRPGDIAIDATVGNGHDTRFLAELVGETGLVYGFDVQPEAIAGTERALADAGIANVTLLLADHASMAKMLADVRGRVGAVMFNLGYLPGGDKALTTRAETSVRAIDGARTLLRPGGVLTVLAYRGHPGGREEAATVRAFLQELVAEETPASHRDDAPTLLVVRR